MNTGKDIIDRQIEWLKLNPKMEGKNIKLYRESGYYTLIINNKTILSMQGKKQISCALSGFLQGLDYA